MRLRNAVIALALAVTSTSASAQVVASTSVNGLGTFIDTQTSLRWLRLDNFFNQSPTQMVATANAAGFILSDLATVQTLWTSLPLSAGQWSSYQSIIGVAPNRELYWGLYDIGTTSDQGWGFAYSNNAAWQTQNATGFDWNTVPNGNSLTADLNLWGYQANVIPEPSSIALLGVGVLALGLVSRRRKAV